MNKTDQGIRGRRRKFLVVMDGALALIVIVLVVQMWLLTASLEAYLSGHHSAAVPGAIVSGLLFAATAALYFLVNGLERQARK